AAAPRAAAPAAASAAATRAADTFVVSEPRRRLLGQPEAADLVEHLRLAVRQRHDAHAGAGLAPCVVATASLPSAGLAFFAARRVRVRVRLRLALFVRLRLRDGEHDELAVGRELRRGAARLLEFLPALRV